MEVVRRVRREGGRKGRGGEEEGERSGGSPSPIIIPSLKAHFCDLTPCQFSARGTCKPTSDNAPTLANRASVLHKDADSR